MSPIDITPIILRIWKVLNDILPQEAGLLNLLIELMHNQGRFFPEDDVMFYIGDPVPWATFVSTGFVTVIAENKTGEQQLVGIFGTDDIKAGPDFFHESPSQYLITGLKGTYIAYITHAQMQIVYERFPETRKLESLIISAYNRRDTAHKQLINVKGIEKVFEFYTLYPAFLEPGVVMKDELIATYLNIRPSTLRLHRGKLFKTKRLINPADAKKGKGI